MQEGTKKTVIWETNSEPPRNYIWIQSDGIAYEYDWDIREWVPSKNIGPGSGGANVVCKTTAKWNETQGYVPAKGEIIVYSDYRQIEKDGQLVDVPGIKIGSGNAYVQDLAFAGDGSAEIDWEEHINNKVIHTNAEEKDFWNSKLNIDDSEISDGNLIFTRN